MPEPRTPLPTLANAMLTLAFEIQSGDGVANAAIHEAGMRLQECSVTLRKIVDLGREAGDSLLGIRGQGAADARKAVSELVKLAYEAASAGNVIASRRLAS